MLLHPGTDMRREGDAGAIVQDDPFDIATNVFRKTGDFTLHSGRLAAWRTGRCGTIWAPFTGSTTFRASAFRASTFRTIAIGAGALWPRLVAGLGPDKRRGGEGSGGGQSRQ